MKIAIPIHSRRRYFAQERDFQAHLMRLSVYACRIARSYFQSPRCGICCANGQEVARIVPRAGLYNPELRQMRCEWDNFNGICLGKQQGQAHDVCFKIWSASYAGHAHGMCAAMAEFL